MMKGDACFRTWLVKAIQTLDPLKLLLSQKAPVTPSLVLHPAYTAK
jgi:hypothetical protein